MVRYGQLLLMRGRDYISRFKPAKRGTCFISVTGARSIFGAWAHRNRRAGMKIAFNSPVWELYSIPLSCHKDSDRRSTLRRERLRSPNQSAPSGGEGRRRVWEKGEGWRKWGMEIQKDKMWRQEWTRSCVCCLRGQWGVIVQKSWVALPPGIFNSQLLYLHVIDKGMILLHMQNIPCLLVKMQQLNILHCVTVIGKIWT